METATHERRHSHDASTQNDMTEYATEEFSVTQLIDAVRPSQMSVAFGPDRSVTQVKKEYADRHTAVDDDAELNVPSVSQTIMCSTVRGVPLVQAQ